MDQEPSPDSVVRPEKELRREVVTGHKRAAALLYYTFENAIDNPVSLIKSTVDGLQQKVYEPNERTLRGLDRNTTAIMRREEELKEAALMITRGIPIPILSLRNRPGSPSEGDIIDLNEVRHIMEQHNNRFKKLAVVELK